MDAREFLEWQAYHRLSPIGPERGDLRAGIVAATVANCHRPKGRAAFKPDQFMPKFRRSRRQSDAEIASIIASAFGAFNAAGRRAAPSGGS